MSVQLYAHQQKAVNELSNGKVLVGGVGTGKTITSLVYYFTDILGGVPGDLSTVKHDVDLYVFTTARKRDELDWQRDAAKLGISGSKDGHILGPTITVDSYNNIGKYQDLTGAFIIMDEQRMVGNGAWVKAFLKMVKKNRWIMLSATPGDKWEDYIPLFIANGFVKNRTQFKNDHIIYAPYSKYPKVQGYRGVGRLIKWRNELLVEMPYSRHTKRHHHTVKVDHDKEMMDLVMKKRWHPFEDRPLRDISEMFINMRRVANGDPSRVEAVLELMQKHPRLIIFYSFDYELEMLRTIAEKRKDVTIAEWNGHKHEKVPTTESWLYLVQYVAGAEAWNCVTTDAVCFFSLTYSYKNFEQAQGRIDRINTPYTDLNYYILVSDSMIDKAVSKALNAKQTFNESDFGLHDVEFEPNFAEKSIS